MTQQPNPPTASPQSAGTEGQSAQSEMLDVLIRGLQTAKQRVDARAANPDEEVARVCSFIYLE
jgi:hypothetical protein